MTREEEYYRRGYELRKSHRTVEYLESQHRLRSALAAHGWYEVPEPEEGEGESIVHTNDLEVTIRGYVMADTVVFDPAGDTYYVRFNDYPNPDDFFTALRAQFDLLVKEWYGPWEEE